MNPTTLTTWQLQSQYAEASTHAEVIGAILNSGALPETMVEEYQGVRDRYIAKADILLAEIHRRQEES